MWTPTEASWSVRRTSSKVTGPKDAQVLHVQLDVANVADGDELELWLHPGKALSEDPPAELRAQKPTMKHLSDGLVAVSHSFSIKAAHGKTFIPIVGHGSDGNGGSPIRVP
jgi:hypothetical protein